MQILKEELVPAMGCTEPIALAYAAAKARELLGCMPDRVLVEASGSIIKNVKSVIVPNTDQLKGIPAAVTAGIVAGKAEKELEVIAKVSSEETKAMRDFLKNVPIDVVFCDYGLTFDISVTLYHQKSTAKVRIVNYHTNIVYMEKNGKVILDTPIRGESEEGLTDRTLLNSRDIWDFIQSVDLEDIRHIIETQVNYNIAIAEEGLKNEYGASIGQVLLKAYGDSIWVKVRAYAAAGSDARMSGCELPVIINSGSGNQGITTSVPVIVYCQEMKIPLEKMLRALVLANLLTIYQKAGIGRLSAFCGVVSAGASAGATIAYLNDCSYEEVMHTLINSLAIVSGMVCDGAKPSCAAKIASAVESGLLGYAMCRQNKCFLAGDGLVDKDFDTTIQNIGRLGRIGMQKTNEEIIKIMVGVKC
jgi:L-cysteine desulfidase